MTDTLYTIPQNWRWELWGNCGKFIAGSGFEKKYQGQKNFSIPFYKVGSLKFTDDSGYIFDESNTITDEVRKILKANLISPNALLFAKIGEAIKLNRRALNKFPCCIDNNTAAFIPEKIFFRYAYYWSYTVNLYDYTNATTVPAIRKSDLEKIPIPVPPLAEQKRIVERLDSLFEKLDAAKKILQDIVDGYELRRAAILHRAFTGELTEDFRKKNNLSLDDWQEKTLGEIVNNHDYKRIPLSNKQRTNIKKIYDYYGASGVIDKVDDYIFDGKYLLIGEDGANLISRSKPIAFIANGKYWVNNHAHILSTKEILVMEFLCFYINYIDLTPYVTGSAQPKLTQKNLNIIPVPLPPLEEQKEISRRLDSLLGKENQAKEIAENLLSEIETLKKTILARAFRGELGTNDPSENAVENFEIERE